MWEAQLPKAACWDSGLGRCWGRGDHHGSAGTSKPAQGREKAVGMGKVMPGAAGGRSPPGSGSYLIALSKVSMEVGGLELGELEVSSRIPTRTLSGHRNINLANILVCPL